MENTSKHKKIKKILIRALLGLVSFILLLIITGFLIVYFNQDKIKRLFITELNKSLRTEISVKDIDFSVFDLFSEQLSSPPASIFGDFNLVICANLLFYYKHEFRKIILEKVGSCLAKGGYLVTGETERDILLRYNYHEIFPQSAIFSING